MSGPEKPAPEKSVQDFLQRWSRRKLGITDPDDGVDVPPPPSQAGEAELAQPAEAPAEPPAIVDPKNLPPIESIDATTDIRAFLAPGVPAELTRAALRRAWTSDPAIRDFVGIAENQWDFTNPDSVPGFGALELSEEIHRMVARLFGETPVSAGGASDPGVSEVESVEAAQTERAPSPLVGEGRGGGSGGEAQAWTEAEHSSSAEPHLATPALNPSPHGGGEYDQHAAPQNNLNTEERGLTLRKHGGALPK
jgi:Protein of unknown function (DUF3306)